MSFICCSTIRKEGLNLAINSNSKIFDKSKLPLDLKSNPNYIWFGFVPNSLFDFILDSKLISDYINYNNWGLEVQDNLNNKIYLRKNYVEEYPYPYCPSIIPKKSLLYNIKSLDDLAILCFEEEDLFLYDSNYKKGNIYINSSKIKVSHILGIQYFNQEKKIDKIVFKDISKDYF